MKRKLFTLCICLGLVVASIITFTACKEKESNPDNNKIYVTNEAELSDSINNEDEGKIIVLNNDIVLNSQLNVEKDITIDLNGKTISNSNDIYNLDTKTWSLFSVKDNGDLTITGNGTIKTKENDCYPVDVRGGKLTVKNGNLIGNISSIYVYNGEALVNGGTCKIQQLDPNKDYSFTLNCYDTNYLNQTAKITVTGGSFYNFDPSNNNAEGTNTSFLKTGYKTEKNNDNYYVVSQENN